MSKDDFLGRWSKRKLTGEQESAEPAEAVVEQVSTPVLADEEMAALSDDAAADLIENENDVEGEEQEPHPAEGIHIETLEYDSDFTVFMSDKVPQTLKRMALRKLWRSNPILANVDGLNDYDEDYSDAAAVFINSVGKVISGAREQFLDDDQIAESKDQVAEESVEKDTSQDMDEEQAEASGVENTEDTEVEDTDVEDIDDLEIAEDVAVEDANTQEDGEEVEEKTEGDGDKPKI